MFDDLEDLYQQLIHEHGRSPRNFRVMDDATTVAQGKNPLCGDEFTLYLKMNGDLIEDISFQGKGCEISTASASLMTTMAKGKQRDEIESLFDAFQHLIKTGKSEQDMGKLNAFDGIHKFPARVKCAILAWHAAVTAAAGKTATVTTDERENE
ncbi:MAG: Fe-S cluster assembly sulfur transfer protein SufU [Limisphaerales bacterium]